NPGKGDIFLKSLPHSGSLPRLGSYDVVTQVQIPGGIDQGVWYITPWTDPYDSVLEDTLADNANPDDPNQFDNNNYKARSIDVLVTRPDLEVALVSTDSSATAGDVLHVQYRVENHGNGAASGGWTDRIYLSDVPNPFASGAKSFLLADVPHTDA